MKRPVGNRFKASVARVGQTKTSRFRTGIIIVAGAMMVHNQGFGSDFVATIDGIKTDIAPVVCMNAKNGQITGLKLIGGSAFFIDGTGTFLTAGHVIDDFMANPKLSDCQIPAIYIPTEGKWHAPPQHFTGHKFMPSGCFIDKEIDIAECRVIDELSHSPVDVFHPMQIVVDEDIQQDGTPVAMSGFPLNNLFPLTSIGNVSGYLFNGSQKRVLIDKPTWPGASGSPVYLENGHVVGMILSRGVGDASGVSIAASGAEILAFMKKNKTIGSTPH